MADDPPSLSRAAWELYDARGFGTTLGDRPVMVVTHGERFPGPTAVLEEGWDTGQSALAAQSTRGTLIVATGCNHMIPSEAPALVVNAIRVALDRLGDAVAQNQSPLEYACPGLANKDRAANT